MLAILTIGGGSWDSSAASKWMGGGSSWSSGQSGSGGQRRSTSDNRDQSRQAMPPPSAQSTPAQSSSSGGPPPSFWEKFSSMFGGAGAGQAPPPPPPPTPGSGSQSSSQSGNGQAPADSQFSMPAQQVGPTGVSQAAPSSSWSAGSQVSGSSQASPSSGWGSGTQASVASQASPGWPPAPSAQSNQRKRGLGDYGPMHGGVSLSNIPYTESGVGGGMPFQSSPESSNMGSKMGDNIPSMSFSLNPAPLPPQPASSVEPIHRVPIEPEYEPSPYVMSKRPFNPSLLVNYPSRVEIPQEQPSYIYLDPSMTSSAQIVPTTNDRVLYVVDPYKNSAGFISAQEPVNPSMNLYRISRDEGEELKDEDPVMVYAIHKNGKEGKEIKKVLVDADQVSISS